MVAGYILISGIFRNEMEEQALAAGMAVPGVSEIQTGERVFEHRGGLPRGAYGAAIAALFQKAEFELQHFQQVAIVFRHTSLHRWIWRGRANGGKPFSSLAAILGARVPTGCDFYHSPQ